MQAPFYPSKDDLQDAIALNSGGFNFARIIGPSIAAVVIAQAGIAWVFGINAVSYLAVLIGLALIRLSPGVDEAGEAGRSTWHGIVEAFTYVRNDRLMWILMRVVALSGGYSREDANAKLSRNHGMIASFSRALAEGLFAQQSDAEFNAVLDATIAGIYAASIT